MFCLLLPYPTAYSEGSSRVHLGQVCTCSAWYTVGRPSQHTNTCRMSRSRTPVCSATTNPALCKQGNLIDAFQGQVLAICFRFPSCHTHCPLAGSDTPPSSGDGQVPSLPQPPPRRAPWVAAAPTSGGRGATASRYWPKLTSLCRGSWKSAKSNQSCGRLVPVGIYDWLRSESGAPLRRAPIGRCCRQSAGTNFPSPFGQLRLKNFREFPGDQAVAAVIACCRDRSLRRESYLQTKKTLPSPSVNELRKFPET
jgi:hypothetical protein